jgi:hemerythrin superfamily protein
MVEAGHSRERRAIVTDSAIKNTGLIDLLLHDHEQAKLLLEGFDSFPGSRAEKFCDIVHTLVRHEVAEEEVLYPAVRKYIDGGDELADARLEEQAEAETALCELENLDPDGEEFLASFMNLRVDVLRHAEAEEQTVFPALASTVSPDEQVRLGQRYERAKNAAPTHPHPHAPDTPPGNLVMGPVAALFDRIRYGVRSALHAEHD